jgi:thioredoxin-like negative regulator of GroEL
MIASVLIERAAQHAGRLKVLKVNIDEESALAARFDARSIPPLVVLREGGEVDRIVGARLLARSRPASPYVLS